MRVWAVVMLTCLVAVTAEAGAVVRAKSNISNNRTSASAYFVIRPVSAQAEGKRITEVTRNGRSFYFDPSEVIVDLADADVAHATVHQVAEAKFAVALPMNADGKKALQAWTSGQLGVFLDGKLVSTPALKSAISDVVAIEGPFSSDDANKVAERIRRGGGE